MHCLIVSSVFEKKGYKQHSNTENLNELLSNNLSLCVVQTHIFISCKYEGSVLSDQGLQYEHLF